MTTFDDSDDIMPANDDWSAIDHLLAAFEQTKDPFGKYLIGLALVHEGQIMAKDIPVEDTVKIAASRSA